MELFNYNFVSDIKKGFIIIRDGKNLHLFSHLLRIKIAEIIAKIARKIEKLHGF